MPDWLPLSPEPITVTLTALPRQLVIIAGVALFLKAFRRLSASNRHCVWAWTTVMVALIPFLSWMLPKWSVVPANLGIFDEELVYTVYVLAGAWAPTLEEMVLPGSPNYGGISWTALIIGVWAAVALILTLSLLFSWFGLARFQRGRLPVVDGPMCERLQATQRLAGIDTFVGLFSSFRCAVPMTWGFFKPAIHLPSIAEDWPYGRLDAVLLHELAHIRRGDALTNLSLHLVCIVFWFNPLIWYAARKAWLAQEQACDDFACERMRSSQYAQHLLQVAADFRTPTRAFAPAAMGISASTQLSIRLTSILDSGRSRQPASPRFALFTLGTLWWTGLVVCLLTIYPVAPAAPTAANADRLIVESPPPNTAAAQETVIGWEDFLLQTIAHFGELERAKPFIEGDGPAGAEQPDSGTTGEGEALLPTAPDLTDRVGTPQRAVLILEALSSEY